MRSLFLEMNNLSIQGIEIAVKTFGIFFFLIQWHEASKSVTIKTQ